MKPELEATAPGRRALRHRAWPVLLVGFDLLVTLVASLGLRALHGAEVLHAEVSAIHRAHGRILSHLAEIRAETYRSSLLLRDHLLAPGLYPGEAFRQELAAVRAAVEVRLAELEALVGPAGAAGLGRLRRGLEGFWGAADATVAASGGVRGLDLESIRRRRAEVTATADEIDRLEAETARREEERLAESRRREQRSLAFTLAGAFALALLISGFAMFYTLRLERRSHGERDRAEAAEAELRRLSQRLVRAQEEERRLLSRELHDEVGQKLTALRLGIGGLERLAPGAGPEFGQQAAETKLLAEETLASVRDLALGLRPSMLDDLGLVPALRWQARDFSRRTGVPARVEAEGDLEHLPEAVRTCAYRVAQEALTNCARHARARAVRVVVREGSGSLWLKVEDDGAGFDPSRRAGGLGLLGIEERVRELGGVVTLASHPGRGTVLDVDLPLQGETA